MTIEQAEQLEFIYNNINKLDLDLVNNVIEIDAFDLGSWGTQTISTPMDKITAFYMTIDGRFTKYTVLNFFDVYLVNGSSTTDIWKDGGDIKIKYASNGKFNCGDGTGPIKLYVI